MDVQALIESDQEDRATRRERTADAVQQASDALNRIIAEHDRRAGESHELLYQRIEALLARPAGVVRDPVAATIPRSSSPPPTATTAPPRKQSTTTTTAPAPGCKRKPKGKKC